MFAPLYDCSICGEVWDVTTTEMIDTERDDVWEELICSKCNGRGVLRARIVNGVHQWHVLTDEEIEREIWVDPDQRLYDSDDDRYSPDYD